MATALRTCKIDGCSGDFALKSGVGRGKMVGKRGRVPKGAGEKRREGEMMGDFWLDLGMATI